MISVMKGLDVPLPIYMYSLNERADTQNPRQNTSQITKLWFVDLHTAR